MTPDCCMAAEIPKLEMRREEGGKLVAVVTGDWRAQAGLPGRRELEAALAGEAARELHWETSGLGEWSTTLVTVVARAHALCAGRRITFVPDGLPAGLRKLLHLAVAVPEKTDARRANARPNWVARCGEATLGLWAAAAEFLGFLGESLLAFGALLRGRAQFRWSDTLLVMQACGPQALGIVALINFLVGLILAFVGSVQLSRFGASVYVADLVAIGTVREMGCMMTGIIMCGRTGAAFAAQLGTMKVNEEIDAFRTFGISPMEFLVLPRMMALFLMMPLLCAFANIIAIGGGFLVSTSMLDVTAVTYLDRTLAAISLRGYCLGLFKGAVFGVLVAMSGCLRGMQCGGNAAAVGEAVTSAVVTGITLIIVSDGVFAVLTSLLDI